MAREAWDIGRPLESWRLMDEAQPDCAYIKRSSFRRVPKFRPYVLDEYDDPDDDVDSVEVQLRRFRAEHVNVDWMAWRAKYRPFTTSNMDDYLRSLYTTDAIREMAMQPSPLLLMLRRTPDPDTYEARIGSYTNTITHMPSWGVKDLP